MSEIVLASISAKYVHTALGIRYLQANLGNLQSRSCFLEFNLGIPVSEMVERIMVERPRILGLSVHIWNVQLTCDLLRNLRVLLPDLIVVTGGPEAGLSDDGSLIVSLSDYVIRGEGEVAFRDLCEKMFRGERPAAKRQVAPPPDLSALVLPYSLFSDEDLRNKLVYVESSRGCPFSCEFCLSSLEKEVRYFDVVGVLCEIDQLIQRGARKFKFVDRTFNVKTSHALEILEFFLARRDLGLFVHFEIVPDRLDPVVLRKMKLFPQGMVQFEVGVQTFDPEVANRISRRQNCEETERNLLFLKNETQVNLHADLILGLPGETLEGFGQGFDRLLSLQPHEIQVGILKKLPGAPISRHDEAWKMRYSPVAPYEILENSVIPFIDMQRMKRFSRYWEIFSNSRCFDETLPLLLRGKSPGESPFRAFLGFSDWTFRNFAATHQISLERRAEFLLSYLTTEMGIAKDRVRSALVEDVIRKRGHRLPPFLRGEVG